jgi:hypothetical protein
MREGLPIPKKIASSPSVLPGLEIFWQAFIKLEYEISIGMEGARRISWNSIHNYCLTNEIFGELASDVEYHVRALESAKIEFEMNKINSKKR